MATKQPVEVTPLTRRDLAETLSVVGSLAANESAELRPEISGLVRQIMFEEGQTVIKDTVLLKIDDAELRAQLAQAEASFNLADTNLKRSISLGETHTIPESEVDRARSDYANTKAALALLRTRLDKTEIRAPFDGIVGARSISPGDYVTPSTIITTIDDLSRMKVEFQVPERYLAKVDTGTGFHLRLRESGGETDMEGRVYFVSTVIDRSTRSSDVKGYVASPTHALKPGMFANIDLVLSVHRQVLTVPEGAVLTLPTGSELVVVGAKDGQPVAEFVPVQLGLRVPGLVEVTPDKEGTLAEGQSVVASGVGALNLYPGLALDPRPLRAEFRVGGQQ